MEKRMMKFGSICVLALIIALLSPALFSQKKQSGNKYDLFLKTSDSWSMLNKELTIPENAQPGNLKNIPGKYFHGALLTKELEGRKPGPVVFHVDFPSRGEFIFFLETVSDTGIVKISLDKKKLKTFTFLTGPEKKGPWVASRLTGNGIYQCDYNREYRVSIPAGKHDITVQNMGTDWLSIGHFVFTKYSGRILDPQYEEWKIYKANLNRIDKRLRNYTENAKNIFALEPGSLNYDVIPTLKVQLENFGKLAKSHTSIDFNLMRTEKELKEIYDYVNSGKDYLKEKRGRIKIGYISEIDSTVQPYDVLIPKSYDPSKKYALVLSLHGYQNEIQKYSELVKDEENPVMDSLGIIKVGVYGRRNHFYYGAAEEDVLAVINEVRSKYSIDIFKIYLTGSSMGGFGTWFNGLNYPCRFAALSPVCAPSIFNGTQFILSISPIEYIVNAQYLPARIYHGAIDSTVNVNNSRQMTEKLKELKYDHVYTEYPGVGHDSWNNADADTDRLPWLLQYTGQPYPAKVVHKAFYLRYGKAYWLQITGKDNWKKPMEIRGEVAGNNEIRISTDNIRSFFIDLKHPGLKSGEPVKLIIDRDSIILNKYTEGMDFHFTKDSVWIAGVPPEKGMLKKSGIEGPSIDFETGKFLLVYGTGKTGLSKKVGTLLQRNYLNSDMNISLIPDTTAIKERSEEKYNLYLIGSPDENLYLKEIVTGLPISFEKDSLALNGTYSRMETGLQMIYPNPKQADKYVIVDIYPEFLPDTDRLVDFPVADYFIYSLKGGKFELLKDEYFGSDWQVIK